ncbi:MAG: ATP-binding cassette domain-containing protein [Patescibacteria group bacterium]|nr:ATP-binding cassette domain-containing protein [Patescibacteria group bacterium]MCL5224328.1 ATP-binding cassette domain-containing protein [Patescibacteria group bacterium]
MADIVAKNISFDAGSGYILRDITASFDSEKTGLVGKNGVGKTTFLKLLVGEIEPSRGKIERLVRTAYLPQDMHVDLSRKVLDVAGANGLGKFPELGIKHIEPNRALGNLSGGERVKVVLASLIASQPKFLILDEPTNNLDRASREVIYKLVENWRGGVLVVSHDRQLLNLVDRILELSENGLRLYGGNYSAYREIKNSESAAAARDVTVKREKFKLAEQQAEAMLERQRVRVRRGRAVKGKLGMSRLELGHMKETSEKTSSKLHLTHIIRVNNAKRALEEAVARIPPENSIKVDISGTEVPSGKLVSTLKDVSFSYGTKPILRKFNLDLYGPVRVSISGPNGSGKTTLVKIILKEINPVVGRVVLGIDRVAYLDQDVVRLSRDATLLNNMERISGLDNEASRKWLARFLFRDSDIIKKVDVLSGGEKMRAALACILSGEKPPQLLVLDEPTNNLDLDSIEKIESALSNFRGALIVISHDADFIKNIGVEEEITLSG